MWYSCFSAQRASLGRLRGSRRLLAALAGGAVLATIAACGGSSTTAPRTIASITVTPSSVSLAPGGTQQFSAVAKDASGSVVAFTPTWAVTGGGTINSTGLFTAGSTPGTFTNAVQATSGGMSGSSTVTVGATQQNLAGTYTMRSVNGKAPPDTVVNTGAVVIEFLDGTLTLTVPSTYKLLFRSRTTSSGTVTSDSSGTTGTYTATGNALTLTTSPSGSPPTSHSVVATVALPTITFTDGGQLFVFSK